MKSHAILLALCGLSLATSQGFATALTGDTLSVGTGNDFFSYSSHSGMIGDRNSGRLTSSLVIYVPP